MRFSTRQLISLLALVWACAPRGGRTVATPPVATAPLPAQALAGREMGGTAVSAAVVPRERAEWRRHFEVEGVSGTIALFDTERNVLECSDVSRCTRAAIPASTFKIVSSMIALETGVVGDAETVLPWDGTRYPTEEWNQDLTLRAAVRLSCVPCFQAIARKIGAERMSEWVTRLDYGNHDTSGELDRFWLSGKLRVSPVEQIDFLRRFEANKLAISARTGEIVEDLITLDVGRDHVLRGKTGLSGSPQALLTAWFVGWLELGERRVFFATLIDQASPDVDVLPARRRVTESVLRALNLLPADATR